MWGQSGPINQTHNEGSAWLNKAEQKIIDLLFLRLFNDTAEFQWAAAGGEDAVECLTKMHHNSLHLSFLIVWHMQITCWMKIKPVTCLCEPIIEPSSLPISKGKGVFYSSICSEERACNASDSHCAARRGGRWRKGLAIYHFCQFWLKKVGWGFFFVINWV